MKLNITVNGSKRTVEQGTLLVVLLAEMGTENRPVAVERNFEIVTAGEYDRCEIADGDVLEVVTLVGGG